MIYTYENTIKTGMAARVFVNGVEAKECVMADTDAGVVECYEIPHKIIGDRIATYMMSGVVTVELAPYV